MSTFEGKTLRKLFLAAALVGLSVIPGKPVYSASEPSFDRGWVELFREEAQSKGVSQQTIDRVFNDIRPLPEIERYLHAQPEMKKTLAEYLDRRLSPARIARGKELLRENQDILRKVQREYGVPPQTIVAIWALETNFGRNTGNTDVIAALITLASVHQDRDRRAYFRNEAIHAMMLVDEGYSEVLDQKGSWAGAMGQTQFMPTSFERFAVDGDGDGRKDIWNDLSDIFASTANFLDTYGWKAGQRWGREVKLPAHFNAGLFTDTLKHQINKTPTEWAALGVRLPGGGALPRDGTMKAMLIAPDGPGGRIFMVYENFRTTMAYNSSYKYALAVNMLADAIGPAPSAGMTLE